MVSATFNTGAFTSRRSPVMAPSAMAATAQPLATAAALGVLMEGGNAVDAAIAAAAVLGVTEPYQTGLGGDAFALLYFAETGQVRALNASGPAPLAATPAAIRARGHEAVPEKGPLSWTVPGCVDGWCQMAEAHGSMDLARILRPAIRYAADGFPVSPVDARAWAENESLLHRDPGASRHLLIEGRAPRAGEMLRQPVLAQTLERLAAGGRDAFYEGPIAHSIAAHSAQQGGLLSLADLAAYRAEWQEPISLAYRGHQIMQCPPNGQGIAALLALRSLDLADFPVLPREGPACMHLLIEAIKRAMAAASVEVADPRFSPAPTCFDTPAVLPGAEVWDSPFYPPGASDTVFIAVVDAAGNAVSFINSVYGSFGSGSVVDALGFALQNRAFGMSMDTAHPNCLAPGKRPYHTIIPGLALKDGKLAAVFGMTGGYMQPQGHVQLLVSMLDYGLDPQAAIDLPRAWWQGHREIAIENGFPAETYEALERQGHTILRRPERRGFGGAQVIIRNQATGVLTAGSEPRQDGCAIGY